MSGRVFLLLAVISLVALVISTSRFLYLERDLGERLLEQVRTETNGAAAEIETKLRGIMLDVDAIAKEVSTREFDRASTSQYVRDKFASSPLIYSLSLAFSPNAYVPGVDLAGPSGAVSTGSPALYRAPYWERLEGKTAPRFEWLYNYAEGGDEFNWYSRPLREGATWTEPYWLTDNLTANESVDVDSDILMTTYSVPFYADESDYEARRNPIGVVPTDVSLSELTAVIRDMNLGKTGFAVLLSARDTTLVHPVFEYVRQGLDRGALAQTPRLGFLASELDCVVGEALVREVEVAGEPVLVGCYEIAETGWRFVTAYASDEIRIDVDEQREHFLLILTSVLFLALSTYTLLVGAYHIARVSRAFSIVYSCLFMLAIVCVWYLARTTYDPTLNDAAAPIISTTDREAFLDYQQKRSREERLPDLIAIRTGIHLQSIEFRSAQNVFLTGYVWQQYTAEQLATLAPGIVVPEAVSINLTEAYRRPTRDGGIVIGWYVETEVRQPFDYTEYPFDSQHVWLRLWHKEFDRNVLLVPDIESYTSKAPGDKPGLDPGIVLSGWVPVSSQFNMVPHNYNENFGIGQSAGRVGAPELYFDVVLQRRFLSPFITTLLPVIVIATLLFAALLNMPKGDANEMRNTGGALMFTILLAHFSLRESLDLTGVVYFESFYFILYFLVFLALVIAFVYHGDHSPQSRQSLHLLTVRLFWPLSTSIVFASSLVTYY